MRMILLFVSLLFFANPSFSAERFFPRGSLSSQEKAAEMLEDWFSKQLRGMNERPLFPAPYGSTIYRLTWLPTFHNPMTFRLVLNPYGGGILYATKNSGKGGYDPGLVLEVREIQLTSANVVKFQKGLAHIEFWSMPRFDEQHHGLDGSMWIMESTNSGVHFFVMRQSPSGTDFQKLRIDFMKLSGMELGDIY